MSEAQFHDSFTDGDFHANPRWTGDTAYFIVNSDSSLQSNGPASSGEIYLSTPWNKIKNTVWEFNAILDFPTSTSNYAKVYISSDSDSLDNDLNGYYIKLGGASGSIDAIDLYRQDGDKKVKIISGIAGFFGSDSNSVSVRMIRDFYGNWTLLADTSGNQNYVIQGTGFDSTYLENSHFGIVSRHSSTRKDQFYFDDFIIRNGPLELLEARAINDTSLILQFSSFIDSSLIGLSQISINNGQVQVTEITQVDGTQDQLKLELDDPLIPGVHSIEVQNIYDDQGNILILDSLSFQYLPKPKPGDIIFNEIMADPEPQIGLPTSEYVEIINTSDHDLRLSELIYSDERTSISLSEELILPNEIVILCRAEDTIDYKFFGRCIGLDSWPNLNNSSDQLSLSLKSGEIIDQVNYHQNWHESEQKREGGWSLERINPYKSCSNYLNWSSSIEGSGGTPGIKNSVFDDSPDLKAPQITHIEVLSDYQIDVHFDEILDSLSSNPKLCTEPYLDFQWTHIGSESLKITFKQPFDSGSIYEIIIDSLKDCEGNITILEKAEFGLGRIPKVFELIITEIMPDPEPSQGLPMTEFFEIYNASTALITLKDLILISGDDSSSFPSITIRPEEYLILSSSDLFSEKSNSLRLSPWPTLSNESDHLRIDHLGQIIHEVEYDIDWMDTDSKKNGGWSLEMIDPSNPCGENDNWTASQDPMGGTPGKRNSVWASNPDLKGPEIYSYFLPDSESINLEFNEKIDINSCQSEFFRINDLPKIKSLNSEKRFTREILIRLENPHISQEKYSLTIEELSDCISNYSFDLRLDYLIPEKPDSGDLFFNEILTDPYSGGSEYIELINTSDKHINLNGLSIKSVNEFNETKAQALLSNKSLHFAPGDILVLSEDTSRITPYYIHSAPSTFFEISEFPVLSNEEGFLLLLDSSENVIDSIHYNENMHFELIHDTKGVALERISMNKASWQYDNWASAAESFGFGTPGIVNSHHFPSVYPENLIDIKPAIFSPDGDGYNDLANISYNSAETNTMLTLEIYNMSGRLVKTLANNVNTGFQNNFFWDGINDSGEKCAMGNYILLAEYFDKLGNTGKIRKVIGLGGRL